MILRCITERKVKFIVDEDLFPKTNIGIHPNENTSTIWLSLNDLLSIIKEHGTSIRIIKIYEFGIHKYR
ncbi:YbaK/EbsC family protein [Paenibacillus cellulositrophicus]|uniref:YbaK/EbsC family protein n=1 Tax=Paenibacillus cellulositrophicus TaxID=562959 RepID=UPI003F7FC10F